MKPTSSILNKCLYIKYFTSLFVITSKSTLTQIYVCPQVRLPFVFGTIAMSLFLVLTPIVKSPQMYHIYVILFILSGLLFYLPFVHFNLGSTYFNKITCFLQLLLNVSPTDDIDEYISIGENVQKNSPAIATKKE